MPGYLKLLLGLLLLSLALAPAIWFVYQARWGHKKQAANLRAVAAMNAARGNFDRAVVLLRKAIEHQPDNAELYVELGRTLLAARQRKQAREAFLQALRIDNELVEPRVRLGMMALEERLLDEARKHLKWLESPARGARVRPYAETIALLRHRLAYYERDLTRARRAAEQALNANPRSVPAALSLARVATIAGDTEFARKILESTLKHAEDKTTIRVHLSEVLELEGQLERAWQTLDLIDTEDQTRPDVLQRRAEVALALKDPKRLELARTMADDAETPANTTEYIRGLEALLRNDRAAAESAFRRALAESPLMTRARLELAKVLVAANELSAARTELETIIVDDPLSREALVQLARLAFLSGRDEDAARRCEELLHMSPHDLETARLLVAARAREGRPEKAVSFFRDMLKEDPRNSTAQMAYSLAWLAASDLDKAIEGTEELLAQSPEARGALELLSAAYAVQRGLADALDRLRLFMSRDPRFVPIRFRLANVYAGIGRHDLAEQELRAILKIDPEFAPAHLGLASLYELRREFDRAIDECNRFLVSEPNSAAGRALLARVLRADDEPERALEVAERPWETPPIGRERFYQLQLARIGFASAVEIGDLERAKRQLEIARSIDQTVPTNMLAAAAIALGRFRDAQRAIQASIAPLQLKRDAVSSDTRWLAAIVALARGQTPRAVSQARLSSPAGSIARSLVLINALVLEGKRDLARRVAAQAAGQDASERGGSLGAMARAIREYAAKIDVDRVARASTPAHRLLVCTAYEFKRPLRPLIEEVLATSGGNLLLRLIAVRALEFLGERDRALQLLREAVKREPDSIAALEACGVALVNAGAYAEAAELLERAAQLAPNEPRVRVFAGLARERKGDTSAAIEAYRSALEIDPESVVAHNRLAGLLVADSAKVDQALKFALRAQQLAPNDSGVLDTLGLVQLRRNKVAKALAALSKARRVDPGEPRIRYHLAQAHYRMGDTERALAELNMAVLLGPNTKAGIEAARMRDKLLDELSGGRRPGATLATAGRLHTGDLVEESIGARGNRHVYRLDLRWDQRVVVRYTGPRDAVTTLTMRAFGQLGDGENLKMSDEEPASNEDDPEAASASQERETPSSDESSIAAPAPVDAGSGKSDASTPATHQTQEDVNAASRARATVGGRILKETEVPARYEVVWKLALERGSYSIEVTASGGTSLANYTLSIEDDAEAPPASDREPNDTVVDAEPITAGVAIDGELGPLTDVDCYRLPQPEGGAFDLDIRAPADAALRLRLIEPGTFGDTVLKSFGVPPSTTAVVKALRPTKAGLVLEIRSRPEGAGRYRIATTRLPETDKRHPQVFSEPDDLPQAAHILELPRLNGRPLTRTATISPPGDRDLFRLPPTPLGFELQAPDDLALIWEAAIPQAGRGLRVLRSARLGPGQRLRIRAIGATGLIVSVRAEQPEQSSLSPYWVRWQRSTTRTADVEPNDVLDRGIRLRAGKPISGVLDTVEDRDVYLLPLRRGATWKITAQAHECDLVVSLLAVRPGGRSPLDVDRRIEVQTGHTLTVDAWQPTEGLGAIEIAARSQAGAYTVAVDETEWRAGTELEPNDLERRAQPIALGRALEGRLDSPSDRDLFRLEVPDGVHELTLTCEVLEGFAPNVSIVEGGLRFADRRATLEGAESLERHLAVRPGAKLLIRVESGSQEALARYRLLVQGR